MKSAKYVSCRISLLAVTLLPAMALLAQEAGVAHPEQLADVITTRPVDAAASAAPTLSAAAPQAISTAPSYAQPQAPAVLLENADTQANTPVATAPVAQLHQRSVPQVLEAENASPQPPATIALQDSGLPAVHSPRASQVDSEIVTQTSGTASELPAGTVFKVLLRDRLSTETTRAGAPFYAALESDVVREGVVVIPAQSVLAGRVTAVHGGTRIGGAASLHLQPDTLTLPDGTVLRLAAQVVDTDLYRSVRINSEGTIVRADNLRGTLSAIGLATGATAVAGALVAGPAGALVGAGLGAGLGTAVVLRQDHEQVLAEGTGLVMSLTAPLDLRTPRDAPAASGR